MRKIIPYIVSAFLAALATIPAIDFAVQIPLRWWPWMATISGFLGILTIFIRTNHFIRFIAVAGYLNCFFSVAPFYSFTAYFLLIGACYFYILCLQITNWKPIFRTLEALVILNVLFIILQAFHKDTLLSFGETNTLYAGVIGNKMQTASMLVVLTAFLVSYRRIYILVPMAASFYCGSLWALLTCGAGWVIFIYKETKKQALVVFILILAVFLGLGIAKGKFSHNLKDVGRLGTWARSIELSNQRALTGWGLGTFKYVYEPLNKIKTWEIWKTAHNTFVQIYFECGFYFLLFSVGAVCFLGYTLIKKGLTNCFVGLSMMGLDSLVHFPERMLQAVFIIIAFFAFCEFKITEKINASQ
jgi:hypothetical protein